MRSDLSNLIEILCNFFYRKFANLQVKKKMFKKHTYNTHPQNPDDILQDLSLSESVQLH